MGCLKGFNISKFQVFIYINTKSAQRYYKKCTYASKAKNICKKDRLIYLIDQFSSIGSLLTSAILFTHVSKP